MPETTAPPLISISGLSYRYGKVVDAPPAIRDVSFELHEGEIVILTGPSGSGKSTLLSIMGLLLRVPPGFVRIGGVDVATASQAEVLELRRRIRFIFQKSHLLGSLTVLQNVMAALIIDRTSDPEWNVSRAELFLQHFGLGELMNRWPEQLSGGQQQRVAVARALVGLPDILLADEPTASLDAESARTVIEKIHEIATKLRCGVVLTTHDDRIMQIATRRMHIVDGVLSVAATAR